MNDVRGERIEGWNSGASVCASLLCGLPRPFNPLQHHRAGLGGQGQVDEFVKKNDTVVSCLITARTGAVSAGKLCDWNKAAEAGMKASGLEYSGAYGFAATETYWPINHMVAAKE